MSELDSPDVPAEGEIIDGKLRVERVIGSGGMGVVLLAMHLHMNMRVAVKLLRASVQGENAEAVPRLLREARAVASITSEHVVRVMDVGARDATTPYIVMEYLEGTDLAKLERAGGLAVDVAVSYVLQACEGIAAAHAAGIVHRDLKPANLFLTTRKDGSPLVKVLDFGVAKAAHAPNEVGLTGPRATLGSPAYMSPEQLRSASDVDARTDVWSLGVILHELLTNELPFHGDNTSAMISAIAADAPTRLRAHAPDAPATLEAIILRCLEKDPEARIATVAELERLLLPFASPRRHHQRSLRWLAFAALIPVAVVSIFFLTKRDPPAIAQVDPAPSITATITPPIEPTPTPTLILTPTTPTLSIPSTRPTSTAFAPAIVIASASASPSTSASVASSAPPMVDPLHDTSLLHRK